LRAALILYVINETALMWYITIYCAVRVVFYARFMHQDNANVRV